MKVGLVLENFDPMRGGLEHWTFQFAKRLSAANCEVHIFACGFENAGSSGSMTFHKVENSPSPWKRAIHMEQALKSFPLDVIHDMGVGRFSDIFHPHGGSTIACWHHNLLRIPKWRQFRLWREKRYREQSAIEAYQIEKTRSTIVAVSKMVQTHFETLHKVGSERIRLIYNGVDTARFSLEASQMHRADRRAALGFTNQDTVFLLVAHNLLLKNAGATIRALAQMRGQGSSARLLIVGGKRQRPFLQMAEQAGIANSVTFLDVVEDIVPFYAVADVYVHPTWYDPCSLVVLEAFACGLPVITSRYNGVSELMQDPAHGRILEDPSDVSTLAECMGSLLDPKAREPISHRARELAMNHSLERQTQEFLDLYLEILSKKPNPKI